MNIYICNIRTLSNGNQFMWSYTRTYYIFGSGDCLQLFLLRNVVFFAILTLEVPIGGDSEIDL